MDRDDEETLMITSESLEKLGGTHTSTSTKPSPRKMDPVVIPTKVSSQSTTHTTTTTSVKGTPRKMDAEI